MKDASNYQLVGGALGAFAYGVEHPYDALLINHTDKGIGVFHLNQPGVPLVYKAEKMEVQKDKLILKGEVTNAVIKVLTNTTFGFIVSSQNVKFDVEKVTSSTYSYTPILSCGKYTTTSLADKVKEVNGIVTDGYGVYNINNEYVLKGTV